VAGSFARRLRARLLAGIAIAAVSTADASGQVSTTYYYDALGRVIAAANSDGKAVGYRYDAAGNRIQVTNTVPFDEIIPTAFTSSTNTPGDGLTTPGAMRDGAYAAAATIHGTNGAANEFITADFGTLKSVDHVDIAPANFAPWTVANTNGAQLQWSTDNVTWTPAATTGGAVLNQYLTVRMGGVIARYVRLFQPAATRLAVGDFRFYGHAASGNQPPVADSFTVTLPAGGGAIDLTSHIHDADLDALSINGFNSPTAAAHGTVTQASSTSFTYTPATGATGDTFSYKITDGHNNFATGLITVAISVPVNHPPVANPEPIGTPPGVPAQVNVLANDTDPDGDPLTILSATNGTKGFVTISGPNLIYSPIPNQSGPDSVTYTISDGHLTATVTDPVTIAFGAGPDHAPTIVFNATTITENTTLSGWTIAANDRDVDGDTLTISGVTSPTANGGTVTVDPGGKTVTYVPMHNFTGIDVIDYTLSDGRDFRAVPGSADVVVDQTVNQPPQAGSTTISTNAGEATSLNITGISSDPEGQEIHVTATTNGTHATTTFNGTTVFYQPIDQFVGTDTFTYTIQDIFGAPSTGTITVILNNEPPSAFDIPVTVANGGSIVINAPQNDPDGQAVAFVSFGAPTRGTIQMSPDGSSATYSSTAGLAGGTDTFQYVVRDTLNAQGSANVIVQVSPPTALSVTANASSYDALLNTIGGGSSFPPAVGLTIANGSGSYTYQWIMVAGGQTDVVPTNPTGATTQFTTNTQNRSATFTAQYFCRVTDTVTHLTGDSGPINVSIEVETGQ